MGENNISVLMSVYIKDNPTFLKEALVSLDKQTFKAKETIIVFDGPLTQELYDVVDAFRFKLNIISIQNKKNMGLAFSLNEGLKQVKYNLVARMDADDISTSERFEKQIAIFNDEKKSVDVVGGYVHEFFNNDILNLGSIRKVPSNLIDIKKFAKFRSPLNHPTVMFRTEAIQKVGGYPTHLNKLEDYALWINLINQGYNVMNIPDVLLYMRTSDSMYERRGGWNQAKAFYVLRKEMYHLGFTNWLEMIEGMLLSILLSISQKGMRKKMYQIVRKYM